jgi:hypothetical protein
MQKVTFIALTLLAGLVLTPPASAINYVDDGGDGTITVGVEDTKTTDGTKGGGGGGGTSKPRCRYELLTPQPPKDSDQWGKNSPDDGKLYVYVCPGTRERTVQVVFIPNADAPVAADPIVLAERAVDQLALTVPKINLAPKPPLQTYTALETWLWLPPSQWKKLSTSVSAGSTTVTATARPIRTEWDMGDGEPTKKCRDAGIAWKSHYPGDKPTSCGYRYKKLSKFADDGSFKIRSRIVYRVNWTCSGSCSASEGTLGEVEGPQSGPVPIVVGERQSVITGTK